MTNREHLLKAINDNFDVFISALADENVCMMGDTQCQDCPFDQFCATNFGPDPDYQIEIKDWLEQEPISLTNLYNRI